MGEERLTLEDQQLLKAVKDKINLTKLQAEKTIAEHQLANSHYQNCLLQFCLKYKLDVNNDKIEDDGRLIRAQLAQPEEAVTATASEVVAASTVVEESK